MSGAAFVLVVSFDSEPLSILEPSELLLAFQPAATIAPVSHVMRRFARNGDAEKRPIGGLSKRAFDVIIAVVGLAVLSPIMAMVAVLIWWHDGGSPFYAHQRVGHRGRRFGCLKFRSMVVDSSSILAELLASDSIAAQEWAETQKLRFDPRVTPIGRAMRMSSLDELPQLFNVLTGDMSIVGPRPIVFAEVQRYGSDYQHYRGCRPGLTGMWQVSGRSDTSYAERIRFDVHYAACWSLLRDVHIVLKTIPAVAARRGSC